MKLNATELVDAARQLEAVGEAYYSAALPKLRSTKARELFRWLKAEESRHSQVFEAMLEGIELADGEWRDDESYLAHMRLMIDGRVFPGPEEAREVASTITDDTQAVQLAIGFERNTIRFFQGLREAVREEERGMLQDMVNEERKHLDALQALLTDSSLKS